jgi:predicted O-methyltransferase YrrM
MRTIITQISSYDAHIRGTETFKIGYPWLTYGAILALEKILDEDRTFNVLEMGSGGSTVFFSNKSEYVLSLELDPLWAKKLRVRIPEKNHNVKLVCGTEKELLDTIKKQENESFNLVLSDIGHDYAKRLVYMNTAIPKLKKGGWLVVDNYAHHPLCDVDWKGWDVYTFDAFRHSGRGTRLCKKLF